ncbi:MAG: bifunctional diguanylate cyclase/phosphodiesterase [Congregibacter sp.]
MPRSLGARLLAMMVLLVGISLLATTIAALRAADSNVRALVTDELIVRERIARNAITQDGRSLQQQLNVITADFGFKAAIASGDGNTILSALANHGERIDADVIILMDEKGEVTLTSIERENVPASLLPNARISQTSASHSLATIAGKPYRVAASPVLAPALIGWLIVGEALDEEALRELEALSDATISIVLSQGDPAEASLLSTASITDRVALKSSDDFEPTFDAMGFLSEKLRRDQGSAAAQFDIYVSLSLRDALANYDPLRFQLVAIAVIALLAALVLSTISARWLTRPIKAMVATATKIADGDYSERAAIHSGTELDALGNALRTMQDTVAEREARIQHQAQHDLLTQLPNRNYLYSLYQRFLREHPQRAKFGLALMELENLQQIRDLYGADFSDEALRECARRVTASLRRGDMAGRVGDQQILLFLQGVDQTAIATVLEKIEEQSREPLVVEGVPVKPELRLGFAFSPAQGSDFDDLQRRAQLALTAARKEGQTHAVYRLGQDEKHLRQIRIANRLQQAISDGDFSLLFQPKYSLTKNRLVGAEALIRWTDAELGSVYPDEFIPIAEQTGLITQLSAWVTDQAIATQKDPALQSLSLSINLSGIDVLQADFVDGLLQKISDAALPPSAIVLEVTETAMMADAETARKNLLRAEQAGIRVSIDDYGTGFSSLAQLRTLPVKELKLDRSLVENIDTELGDRLIVQSTIDMAHHLNLEVVAEGVETLEVLEELVALGCDTLQGYLLAKPLPLGELKSLVTQGSEAMSEIRETLEKRQQSL